jgi:hypothetical protein
MVASSQEEAGAHADSLAQSGNSPPKSSGHACMHACLRMLLPTCLISDASQYFFLVALAEGCRQYTLLRAAVHWPLVTRPYRAKPHCSRTCSSPNKLSHVRIRPGVDSILVVAPNGTVMVTEELWAFRPPPDSTTAGWCCLC